MKLLGVIIVGFDVTYQLLIIFFAFVRFEVFITVKILVLVFLDMTRCSQVGGYRSTSGWRQ
jgi:hypothetical protein